MSWCMHFLSRSVIYTRSRERVKASVDFIIPFINLTFAKASVDAAVKIGNSNGLIFKIKTFLSTVFQLFLREKILWILGKTLQLHKNGSKLSMSRILKNYCACIMKKPSTTARN